MRYFRKNMLLGEKRAYLRTGRAGGGYKTGCATTYLTKLPT